MSSDADEVLPTTLALHALIEASLHRAKASRDRPLPDSLYFTSRSDQIVPADVVRDPDLEPVDKLVWMVIKLHGAGEAERIAFPSYSTIATQANIASSSTIARAIAILRLTRWLTLCARLRQRSGKFSGNIFVLHDTPFPLADTLYFDQGYWEFVGQAQQHSHARVRCVAQVIVSRLDQAQRASTQTSHHELLHQKAKTADPNLGVSTSTPHQNSNYRVRYSNTAEPDLGTSTPRPHQNSNTADRDLGTSTSTSNQNSKTVGSHLDVMGSTGTTRMGNRDSDGQNLNMTHQNSKTGTVVRSSCSNNYKYKTTTTTTNNSYGNCRGFPHQKSKTVVTVEPTLIYPPRLSATQRQVAEGYLAQLAPELRQPVLDELQGRLASEQRGMPPVYDELRFLQRLCSAAQAGNFVPNLGLKVFEARQDLERHVIPPTSPTPPPKALSGRGTAQADEHLARIRAMLDPDS